MILVTGATGFIGRAVLAHAASSQAEPLRAAVRRTTPDLPDGVEGVVIGDLAPDTNWRPALHGVDMLVHTAARVHVMRETAADPLSAFRHVNTMGTLNLARQAAGAGVRRFVFISSIKVNGERTVPGRPFTADEQPAPVDPYGVSKREAEQGLRRLAQETGLEVVIIRPVLVYGPGVKANFLTMMRALHKGIPLPLGSIHNQRSLVALANLVDLVATCLRHPTAANQTFMVSDGDDLSTPALLRRVAAAMGKRARLIPVPASVLRSAAHLIGRADVAQRLCDSLQVDISKTRQLLTWTPPVSVDDALAQTVQHFLAHAC